MEDTAGDVDQGGAAAPAAPSAPRAEGALGVGGGPAPRARVNGVKSSLRTLDVLELLSSSPQRRTVANMARELCIPKSSLHGILRTMAARGWLEVDATGTLYGVGLRALIAGNAYVESDDIVVLAQSALDRLSDLTAETVHLGRLDGADIVYLAKRESIHALRLYSAVGRRLPAHATALGKVLLSQLAPDDVEARLSWPLPELTEYTITDPDVLHTELAAVRERGFATDDGENTLGIKCVAVALPRLGESLNAVSVSVPESRMTQDRRAEIIDALRGEAQTIGSVSVHLRA